MPISDKAYYLLQCYADNTATDAEMEELSAWLNEPGNDLAAKECLNEIFKQTPPLLHHGEARLQSILAQIKTLETSEAAPARIKSIGRWWWAAALILLLFTAGMVFLLQTNHNEKPVIAAKQYKGDVAPGHNGAVLHLSNGTTMVLDSAKNGTIAMQGRIKAVKANGTLSYEGQTNEVLYNTVATDKGRQWQLVLPDGSKVWLNAASSIHYPLAFSGTERMVEVTGEAYFEVVHNAKQPFKAKAGGQVIEDIGTVFNVNAYADEPAMKTTLVEGAVRVWLNEGSQMLKPGQQATVTDGQLNAGPGNIEEAIAWKNGLFSFEHADIYTVMRQISRWYNVEVKFEGKPDNIPFQGEIGRSLTLAQVLKGLEQIHVHFRIEEDKRIVILP